MMVANPAKTKTAVTPRHVAVIMDGNGRWALISWPSRTATDTTRPGIGQSKSFDVSGGTLTGIRRSSAAMRGSIGRASTDSPCQSSLNPPVVGRTCTDTGRRPTLPSQTGSPGRHADATSKGGPPSTVTASESAGWTTPSTIWTACVPSPIRTAQSRFSAPECGASRPGRWSRRARRVNSTALATAESTASSSVSGLRGTKPSGNSSAMKAVERRPSRQRGCCIRAARNGMLCAMPSTTNRSSAVAIASIASPRLGAQLHSLASMGS